MSDIIPRTQRDIVHAMPRTRFRMPRTPRELLTLLSYHSDQRGLEGLLDLIDFSGVMPSDIYYVLLARAPENTEVAVPQPGFDPREFFKATLLSDEFRRNILGYFLTAFAEKGRDVFFHVPKCAGTDLIFNLALSHLPLPKMLEVHGWVTDEEFLAAVGGIARATPFHERIFAYGHMELGEFINAAGARPIDRFFTVIRDPLDLMLSQANYAIGRLRQDPTGQDPDTAETLQCLGIPRLPENIDNRELKDLASRALLHPMIAWPNRACTYLGRGMTGLYATAIDRIVVHDVEITTTSHYDRWLLERWGIGHSRRHNRSDAILTRNELRWLYADALQSATAEDQKLFDVVSWALAQTGAASVTGMEIANLAGEWLPEGRPPSMAAGPTPMASTPPAPAPAPVTEPNLLVAEEPDGVNLFLQPAPNTNPGGPRSDTVLFINFGVGGTGREYLLDGWSVTEETYTWANARMSRLQLPPFRSTGLCILRLIGNPFVWEDRIPFQRIELSVNGERLGSARIRDISVIECEVPRRLLSDDEPINITLRFPTAAVPREICGIDDDRLLAFALHQVMVVRIS